MREFADGVAFWRSRTAAWPLDLHNADYQRWSRENPHGDFTLEWWQPFLKSLQRWVATRPTSGRELTERFTAIVAELRDAWAVACEPAVELDISTVMWEQVAAFPDVVGTIKPTLKPSPVFTSKFCHFLLPKVFPVVDNEALGNAWPTYEHYFRFVQLEWAGTKPQDRADLTAALTEQVEGTGSSLFPGFPMVNKIVELRLIGRRHP